MALFENKKTGFTRYRFLSLLCVGLWVASYLGCAGGEYRQYDVALSPAASKAEAFFYGGDYEKAVPMYQKALAEYQKQKNDIGVLYCLEKMGWIFRETGEYGKAMEMFQKAYPMGVRLNGDAAEIDTDIGDVYLFTGDSQKAVSHYEKALSTLKDFVFKTEYTSPPNQAETTVMTRKIKAIIHTRDMLAIHYYFSGEYEKALYHLNVADELIKRVMYVANHSLYGIFFKPPTDMYEGIGFCQTILGATYGEMGEFDRAWQHFDRGKTAFETAGKAFGLLVNRALRLKVEYRAGLISTTNADLAEYDAFLDEAERLGALEIVWRVCHVFGGAFSDEKNYSLARKYYKRALNALEMTRSKLREDSIKKMFASSVQDVYSDMISLLFTMNRFEEGFDYLERAKARAFLDLLAGRSVKEKKAVDRLLIHRQHEIQEAIDVHARRLKVVEGADRETVYKSYRSLLKEKEKVLNAIKEQSLEYAATTTVATVPVKRIAQKLAGDTALVSYFFGKDRGYVWVVDRKGVHAESMRIGKGELGELVSEYREAIFSQQEMLLEEVGQELTGILLKPVRSQIASASHLIIVPSGPLHYLPFACLPVKGKRYLIQTHTLTLLPNASSLFFLDKEVSKEKDSLLAMGNPEREGDVPALEFAEKEVQAISRRFTKPDIRTGRDAVESVFGTEKLLGTGIIHIAAHGVYDTRFPLKSALLLAKDAESDGNLETFEIFSLNINPGLVVLSACESGIGKIEGGDEVQSLNRAFLYAGAGGVAASLWSVSDQSTYQLMEYFYDELVKSPPADALRSAQIRLMAAYPDPFFWGPFYLTGGLSQ